MTVFQEPIANIAGATDQLPVSFWATRIRQGPGGVGITTTTREDVYPVDGLLTTPDITPGQAKVKIGDNEFLIDVVDSETPALLSDAIELGSIPEPPPTWKDVADGVYAPLYAIPELVNEAIAADGTITAAAVEAAEEAVDGQVEERGLIAAPEIIESDEYEGGIPFVDNDGRVFGGIKADGTAKFAKGIALTPEVNAGPFENGTVFVDQTGRILGGFHEDGTFEALKMASGSDEAVAEGQTISLKTKKVAAGDSLTRGYDESGDWLLTEAWPYLLSQLDTDADYTNLGTSGQTVDEESIRFGALVLQCTVAGGSIPASGSVGVTIPAGVGWRPSRTWTWQGTIAGVHGTLTRTTSATTALTFARTTSGGAVSVATAVPFLCDDAVHEWDTAIIGIGRNDVTNNTLGLHATTREHVVAGTVRMVNHLAPQRKRFLLWGTCNATSETAGSTNHTTVLGINSDLAALYPNNFVDLRQYIVHELIYDMGLTPDATDLSHMAADAPPPSIMVPGDGIHFAKAAHPFFADFFHTQLLRRDWI